MYCELQARTGFTFLAGASDPEELVGRAAALGLPALAVTDLDGVYALPRARDAIRSKSLPLRLICGAEVTLAEGGRVTLLAATREGWSNLTELLTEGRTACEKGQSRVPLASVLARAAGLWAHALVLPGWPPAPPLRAAAPDAARGWIASTRRDGQAIARQSPPEPLERAAQLREAFGDRFSLAVTRHLAAGDDARARAQAAAARRLGVPLVAVGDCYTHDRNRQPLQDVLTCIRLKTDVRRAGKRLFPNAERTLRPPAELARLFADYPDAIERTEAIADACRFQLDELAYRFPLNDVPAGETPHGWLRRLCDDGAQRRYPSGTPPEVRAQLEHELRLVKELGVEGFFLAMNDIVSFARSKAILCQGRGSAANSVICWLLGITSIDPVRMGLLFERFLSAERGEPPDIDVDFEHERREEVIQHVYAKHGRARAAMVSEVIGYRGKSAIRDVGKALGLSLDQVDRLSRFASDGGLVESASGEERVRAPIVHEGSTEWWQPLTGPVRVNEDAVRRAGLDPKDPGVRKAVLLAHEARGLPRHLGIHVGGFVITGVDRVTELVPVENASMPGRTVVQWDKDDCASVGLLKLDLLGLGMLTCLRKCMDLVRAHEGLDYSLATLPPEDPATYDMICDGDTVGVFQIESRAQMQMLPRLKPRCFYDLVIEVAIIRPGPIQGDMVHPYLRRRNGEEPVEYPHPSLEPILKKTLGVPLFQEQGMKLAVAAAGFTPGEAEELRRAMGHKRSRERMAELKEKLIRGMEHNGIGREYGERVYKQLSGFADYGFPESHAASFALLVYASCYLKRHHPAAFTCALLNSQPMGFYAPHTLVDDAKRHRVPVRPVDVQRSAWDCTLEETPGEAPRLALRLGLRMVRGLSEAIGRRLEAIAPPANGARFSSVADLAARASLRRTDVARLAAAGALASFGLDRREALWAAQALAPRGDLFHGVHTDEPAPGLTPLTPAERVHADYAAAGASAEEHPVAFLRDELTAFGALDSSQIARARTGKRVRAAGMAIVRQRPGTAKGMVFVTLEDEHGFVNLVLTPDVFEATDPDARAALFCAADGRVERSGKVVNVRVERLIALRASVAGAKSRDFH